MNTVWRNWNNNDLGKDPDKFHTLIRPCYLNNIHVSLVCNAKEVYANNDQALVLQGPTQCNRGDYIYVNVSASLHFNADRYDVGIYTATSGCTGGSAVNSCGVLGSTCAVDILEADDAARAPNNIGQVDGMDSCYDIDTSGFTRRLTSADGNDGPPPNLRRLQGPQETGFDLEVFYFQPNLKIPCDE